MPRSTTTYDLQAEAQRLDRELDEAADEAAEATEGSSAYEEAVARGRQLERELAGVEWALDPDEEEDRDPYEEVTLGALNAREYGEIGDRASSAMEQSTTHASGISSASGVQRIFFAAGGLADAPFLSDSADFEEKARAVGDVAPQFLYWMEQRVDELTTPDVEGNGFSQRLEARKSGGTSE